MQNNTSFEISEICKENEILISANCGIIPSSTVKKNNDTQIR